MPPELKVRRVKQELIVRPVPQELKVQPVPQGLRVKHSPQPMPQELQTGVNSDTSVGSFKEGIDSGIVSVETLSVLL